MLSLLFASSLAVTFHEQSDIYLEVIENENSSAKYLRHLTPLIGDEDDLFYFNKQARFFKNAAQGF